MPNENGMQAEAIGSAPPAEATCMFCHTSLKDEGEAFMVHLDQSRDCRDMYRSWLANLDMDRPGGG